MAIGALGPWVTLGNLASFYGYQGDGWIVVVGVAIAITTLLVRQPRRLAALGFVAATTAFAIWKITAWLTDAPAGNITHLTLGWGLPFVIAGGLGAGIALVADMRHALPPALPGAVTSAPRNTPDWPITPNLKLAGGLMMLLALGLIVYFWFAFQERPQVFSKTEYGWDTSGPAEAGWPQYMMLALMGAGGLGLFGGFLALASVSSKLVARLSYVLVAAFLVAGAVETFRVAAHPFIIGGSLVGAAGAAYASWTIHKGRVRSPAPDNPTSA